MDSPTIMPPSIPARRVVAFDEVAGLGREALVRAAEAAHAEGEPLAVDYAVGAEGESLTSVNATLALAVDLYDRFGAVPRVRYLRAGLERFRWTFEERLRAAAGPQKLIMNVTYVCNNRCTFCAVGTRTQVDGHPERQREHLEKYRAMGVRMVDFDGGEPTLNPELIALVRYARSLGYDRINVTSNGRMCFYEGYARDLVRSGLTTLLFSVHGADARTHAQQVGVAEAFEQTVGGIRHARRHAPADVELGMNVTVTKGNHRQLDALVALAWGLGLRWVNLQFLTPFGRATTWVAPDTQVAADEAMRVIDRWGERVKFQVINLPFCFMPGYERFMVGDLQKLQRRMVFVNNDDVNLADYLAAQRVKKPVCDACPHAVFCGGFYELHDVPEAPWIVRSEDLVRPVFKRPAEESAG